MSLIFCLISLRLEVKQGSYKWFEFRKFRLTFLWWFSLANKDGIQRNQLPFFCVEGKKKNLFSQVTSWQLHLLYFPLLPSFGGENTFFFNKISLRFLDTFWCLIWHEKKAQNEEGTLKIHQILVLDVDCSKRERCLICSKVSHIKAKP